MATRKKKHDFEKLTDFDRTLRKLVEVPKEVVKQREEEAKRKRKARG